MKSPRDSARSNAGSDQVQSSGRRLLIKIIEAFRPPNDTGAEAAYLQFAIVQPPAQQCMVHIEIGEKAAVLLKLGSHISNCLERAANAEQRAQEATGDDTRAEQELLAQSWRHLARSYQFVETLERFLSQTNGTSKDIFPPQFLDLIGDPPQAPAPESKPIIRRPRIKQETSLKDRLLKGAQNARDEAARLPSGPERDRLLKKAQQSETAATIDAWVSSPGSSPPENFTLPKKPKA